MSIRGVAREAYEEAVSVLALSALGGLFSGVVLGGMESELSVIPGLLVLVPALLATRGNVYGSLGARLATGLHQGLVDPDVSLADDRVRAAVTAAMANGVAVSAVAAVLGYGVLLALGRPAAPLPALLVVALVAGVLSGIGLTVVVVAAVFWGFRNGMNPDTLAGPVVTTTGDVIGIATMLAGARLVIALGVV